MVFYSVVRNDVRLQSALRLNLLIYRRKNFVGTSEVVMVTRKFYFLINKDISQTLLFS